MFPEYRDLIHDLKTRDHHFAKLFERHNEIDHRVKRMEAGEEPATHEAIETLKKEKLHLKDEMYAMLRKADTARKTG